MPGDIYADVSSKWFPPNIVISQVIAMMRRPCVRALSTHIYQSYRSAPRVNPCFTDPLHITLTKLPMANTSSSRWLQILCDFHKKSARQAAGYYGIFILLVIFIQICQRCAIFWQASCCFHGETWAPTTTVDTTNTTAIIPGNENNQNFTEARSSPEISTPCECYTFRMLMFVSN